MPQANKYLIEAIQRIQFNNKWNKEELCREFDVNMADLHRYMKGEEAPTESLLLIIRSELQRGGFERRTKIRTGEIVERIVEIERQLDRIEKIMGQFSEAAGLNPETIAPSIEPSSSESVEKE